MDARKNPNIMDLNETKDRQSEFGKSGYDCSKIIECIRKLLVNEYSCETKIEDDFNDCIIGKVGEKNIEQQINVINHAIEEFESIDYVEQDNNDNPIAVKDSLRPFFYATRDVLKNFSKERKIYDLDLADKYLDSFLNLSRKVVFFPNSILLDDVSFRKSKFLQNILTLFVYKSFSNKDKKGQLKHYAYSLFDPFAYDTLQRILLNIKFFRQQDKHFSSLVNQLRVELFLRRAERAFNRFICLEGRTYRISLNRHDSLMYASPYEELSSIEEIKPIRLFEKIATYIQKNVKKSEDAYFCVKICIIGHTERSKNNQEKELEDLLMMLLNWYDRRFCSCLNQIPKLELRITNLISENDWPKSNFLHEREEIECKVKENVAYCNIQKLNYNNTFCFNTKKISDLIHDNNIVFILDCPWLTEENFDIKKDSSILYFCKSIQTRSRRFDSDKFEESSDCLDSKKPTVFKDLDSQYNRIMASNTTSAGEIVRIFKDRLIRKIDAITREPNEKITKEVYIFSSEEDGIDYSYISTYPLTRLERYDGKNMHIIKFSNCCTDILCYENSEINIQVRLWSILKYLSISFAYNQFKLNIQKIFGNCILKTTDFFEIYRSIIVDIIVDSNMTDIYLSIGFQKNFEDLLKRLVENPKHRYTIQEKLYICIADFVEEICTKLVFSDKKYMFSDNIKSGFLMNLYSSVKNVTQMFFWHKYRMAFLNKHLETFNVKFDKNYDPHRVFKYDDDYGKDFFMDKKVYDKLLLFLEYNDDISIGIRSMLREASELFNESKYMNAVMDNIYQVCRNTEDCKSTLYNNLLSALERMKHSE